MAKPRAGRPTNAENPQIQFDAEPPEGNLCLGDREVWIEGSVHIYDEDDAALALRGPLQRLVERLTQTRYTELGERPPGALTYCERVIDRTPLGQRPRKWVRRQGWDQRMTLGTLEALLAALPGRTLSQLAVELYPNGLGTSKEREPSLRVALHRLRQAGKLRIEHQTIDGRRRAVYYALMAPYLEPLDQSTQLVATVVRAWLGDGDEVRADHAGLVRHLMQLFEFNRDRPLEAWRDPRGVLKTPAQALPPWDEHLPPEPIKEDAY